MPRRTRPIPLLLLTALSLTAAELAPAPAQAAYTITEYLAADGRRRAARGRGARLRR